MGSERDLHGITGKVDRKVFILLSCVCWRGDDVEVFFKNPHTDTAQQLRNGMATLAPNWECVICLNELSEANGSTSLWVCNHSVCSACATSHRDAYMANRNTCPVCRGGMVPVFTVSK